MTTIVDILLKELQEEQDSYIDALCWGTSLELTEIRRLQGQISLCAKLMLRIKELMRDPDEVENYDADDGENG